MLIRAEHESLYFLVEDKQYRALGEEAAPPPPSILIIGTIVIDREQISPARLALIFVGGFSDL